MKQIVTLSLLKYLEQMGFGKIDEDLFWEKLGIGREGLYVTDLGGSQDRYSRPSVTYQLYCRQDDDLKTYDLIQKVARLLHHSYAKCTLPAVPECDVGGVVGVTIMPPSSITNEGQDVDGRLIYSLTGTIYYDMELDKSDSPIVKDAVTTEEGSQILTQNNYVITKEINGRN